MVKWHAGYNKYNFNEATMAGHRVTNDQLDLVTAKNQEDDQIST